MKNIILPIALAIQFTALNAFAASPTDIKKYEMQKEVNGKTCAEFKHNLIGVLTSNPDFPELEGAHPGTEKYKLSQYAVRLMLKKSLECM